MEKIKGYTEEEIRAFVAFLEEGKKSGKNLSALFAEYGAAHGRATGSVRNFYYELLSLAEKDEAVRAKYLAGSELRAEPVRGFGEGEARDMMKEILRRRGSGRSVRAAIRDMAGGDDKLALRYQNKYRNMVSHAPDAVRELAREVERETGKPLPPLSGRGVRDEVLERLKTEIDGLARRLAAHLRRENDLLRERLVVLERENLRLRAAAGPEKALALPFSENFRKKHSS